MPKLENSQKAQLYLNQLRLTSENRAVRHFLDIDVDAASDLFRDLPHVIEDDAEQRSRFIVLPLGKELCTVTTMGEFWHNCLKSLLVTRGGEGAGYLEIFKLNATLDQYPARTALAPEAQDGLDAYSALMRLCSEFGRRPVLLVEDLEVLIPGLVPLHAWGLRKRLQEEDGPVMISSGRQYFAELGDSTSAFYDFFRVFTWVLSD